MDEAYRVQRLYHASHLSEVQRDDSQGRSHTTYCVSLTRHINTVDLLRECKEKTGEGVDGEVGERDQTRVLFHQYK